MTAEAAPEGQSFSRATTRSNARLIEIAAALLLLVPLASSPVLPLIDLYNHLARLYVLSHVESQAGFSQNYTEAWQLLPNLGFDIIATPLLTVAEPLFAAKIIVAVILLTQFFGVLFLHRSLWPRSNGVLPALLLTATLYSYILNWGFANFLFGLGLSFWAAGLWVRLRSRMRIAVPVGVVAALVIFFCHGFAFALYGILVGGLELGRWLQSRDRSPGALAQGMAGLTAQAVLPLILFLNMPTATASGATGSTLANVLRHSRMGSLGERLQTEAVYRAQTIFRVAESSYPWLDVATFIAIAGLLTFGLWKGVFRAHRWAWPALGLFALLCVVTPPSLFGVGYVSDRLPLMFVLAAFAAISTTSALARPLMLAIAAIAAVRIAAIAIGWSDYRDDYRDFLSVTAEIPRGALVAEVIPGGEDPRDAPLPRCQMYGPLLVPLRQAAVPLFAWSSAQPLQLDGRLAEATADSRAGLPESRGKEDDRAALWLQQIASQGGFDYVLVCQPGQLGKPFPANLEKVAERGSLALYRVR